MRWLSEWWRAKSILDRLFFWGDVAFGALVLSALLQTIALIGRLLTFLVKGN